MLSTDLAILLPKSKPMSSMVTTPSSSTSFPSSAKILMLVLFLSVIRACVPKLNLDDVFEQKNEIAKSVEEELDKAMTAYGYEILQTLIIDIEPDQQVKRAMNEINAGKET